METRSKDNEGKVREKCSIKWRTVDCPWCGTRLRLWWPSKGHKMKAFLCRFCRTVFWMDRFGAIQGELGVVTKEQQNRHLAYGDGLEAVRLG